MSMYTHILEAALRERPQAETGMTTGEALAKLVDSASIWTRSLLNRAWTGVRRLWPTRWRTISLSSTSPGVSVSTVTRASFDQPQRRRIELERELISRGIRLDELDQAGELHLRSTADEAQLCPGAVNPGCLGRTFLETRGEGGGLGAALHPQLGQQIRDVVLHRLLGQDHGVGDLAIGVTLGDEFKDPSLLWSQARQSLVFVGTRPKAVRGRVSVREGSSKDCPSPARRTASTRSVLPTRFNR